MDNPDVTAAERWMNHFQVKHHPMLTAWFRHVIHRQGASDPETVLRKMTILLGQKAQWSTTPSTRELVEQALVGIRCQGAREYAQHILEAGEGA
jgi:hypothetical protein